MEVLNLNQTTFNQEDGLSVALGYFDGLHIGHQLVIKEAIEYAKANGLKSAVMTFSPNPNVILKKLTCEQLITPPLEKIRLLKQLGVDYLIILTFNEDLASLEAVDFINRYLIGLNVNHVSTGFDFRFGKKGEGSVELLYKYSEKFSLNVTAKKEIENEKIGSTQIKSYLAVGNIQKANEMLGRPYTISGIVISGQQKGRQIGFPTANIGLQEPYIIPKNGVYIVKAIVGDQTYPAMCNIGHNPTFNFIDRLSIEVHILDFNQDIYGQAVKVEFYERLRDEERFASIQALMTQLDCDREMVRRYFKLDLN